MTTPPNSDLREGSTPPRDQIAPVDLQADPSQWLRGRALLFVTAAAVLALVITIIVCLVIYATPPMEPLQIPTEPRI
jgi:hypothetical protein